MHSVRFVLIRNIRQVTMRHSGGTGFQSKTVLLASFKAVLVLLLHLSWRQPGWYNESSHDRLLSNSCRRYTYTAKSTLYKPLQLKQHYYIIQTVSLRATI